MVEASWLDTSRVINSTNCLSPTISIYHIKGACLIPFFGRGRGAPFLRFWYQKRLIILFSRDQKNCTAEIGLNYLENIGEKVIIHGYFNYAFKARFIQPQ